MLRLNSGDIIVDIGARRQHYPVVRFVSTCEIRVDLVKNCSSESGLLPLTTLNRTQLIGPHFYLV